MRTIGWLFILFGIWLIRAGFRGQVIDESGQFILPQVIEDTLTAIITGDEAKLNELDAQTSGSGLLEPTPDEQPPVLLEGSTPAGAGTGQGNADAFAASGVRGKVVAAAQSYRNDRYSQARRWQAGWSDCSSFVGKALKKAGIKPPGSSQVHSYWMSKQWPKIPASQVQAGDIAHTLGHMVLMTGKTSGIGQQRPGVNVKSGSINSLFGTTHVTYRTYSGYPKGSGGGGGGGGSSSF
jgi:hypothetical protein